MSTVISSVSETARRLRMAACLDKVLSQQRLRLLSFPFNEPDFKTCRTCRYYYGLTYGGHSLVCAPHPYGPLENPCRDWECSPR